MNMTFQNFVRKTRLAQSIINYCVIVYMDDILVYSSSYEGHVRHIEWALHALRDAGFKVALEKCQFFLTTISFLGHVVTEKGLQLEPQKVAAVRDAPVPTTITQVRAFLGLASYYRRFIKGFAATAGPLTNLLRKDRPLIWTQECDQAFSKLKAALISASVLIRPDPEKPFVLIIDWQPEAISAILAQVGPCGLESVVEYACPPASATTPLQRENATRLSGESWTACLEEPRDEDTLPSRQEYLKPYNIIPHAFYPKAEEVVVDDDEEDNDEETSEEGSYSEYSQGELGEEEEEEGEEGIASEWEALPEEAARTGTEAEDPEATRKREEIAIRKRQLEFASGASLRIGNDPTRDLEPPKPKDDNPAAATSSTARRRRSRSPSSSSPTRPPVRPRTNAGNRPSSSDAIPPTP
ncbi:hypothetical protein CBR_g30388 [Chara braunii]|uniref:Reverse transcriptase domain-containing protein n=1 Tax=Chara braunii TaxID=69332 RepID=A0A388JX86_CHABU|nr:hypothetical protein CBR_g30388 [Chara braunii]|eukprot:GBG62434.1 hypothetical protein CBR_g30388 [Chara braunii]